MEPKLTIVYHLHNSYVNTKESILSILSQTDKNFNVVCILDNIDNGIKKLLADKDIMGLANFKKGVSTIILDKTLGHSWCFNQANKLVKTPYVYYASGGCIFHKDFVKEINNKLEESNPDLLIFNYDEKAYEHFLTLTEKTDNYHFYQTFLKSYTNKIFKFSFLKSHNISFAEFKHYTFYFVYKVISHSPYIEQLPKVLVDVTFSKHPGYNTYDVLSQFEEIYTKHKDSEFFKQFHDSIEYMFIRTAFFTFLYYMYRNTYKENKKAFKISVEKAANSVEKYAPNWRKNIYLNEKDTMDSPYIWNYLKNFDTNIKKIAKLMERVQKENVL